MNTNPNIDPKEFLAAVKPMLESKDMDGLVTTLKQRWTAEQIVSLLSATTSCDVRKVASLALSLVGGKCCVEPLLTALKDPDPMVNAMAEHALWSVWFRLSTPEANHALCRGASAMGQKQFEDAIAQFDEAIRIDPKFAEAYNQRAIARYLMENFRASIADCKRATQRMPNHFGAWAGMGHCHAYLEEFEEAMNCYRKSLEINPHSDCLRQTMCELAKRV